MSTVRFFVNDEGVSPIVATLVLIVVAIIGAAAVALIMGSFSTNVQHQTNSNGADQSRITINIGDGMIDNATIQLLAKAYMQNNTGVKVTAYRSGIQGGATDSGILDITTSSMPITNPAMTDLKAKYPDLQFKTYGMGGVVFVGGTGTTVTTVDCNSLGHAYHTGSPADINAAIPGASYLIIYSKNNQPDEQVNQWLLTGTSDYQNLDDRDSGGNVKDYDSYDEALAAIEQNPNYFGFIDFGHAESAGSAVNHFYTIHDGTGTYTASSNTIVQAERDFNNGLSSSTSYPISLVYPLQFVTKGPSSVLVQSFINYAMCPDSEWAYQQGHLQSLNDIGA